MIKVKTLYFHFTCDGLVKLTADKLRGFIANRFRDYPIIHHHLDNDRFLYRTPLIQYKIIEGRPLVIGINEGAQILQRIYDEVDYIKVDDSEYPIKEKVIILRTDYFGVTETNISYSFLTPWLALNEENYDKYIRTGAWQKRKELLDKIIIGNLISLSKGIGYTAEKPIEANILQIKEVPTSLKGNPMLGFLGRFSVNFEIPDYWGIGKSVSRGFGTVERCSS